MTDEQEHQDKLDLFAGRITRLRGAETEAWVQVRATAKAFTNILGTSDAALRAVQQAYWATEEPFDEACDLTSQRCDAEAALKAYQEERAVALAARAEMAKRTFAGQEVE